MAIARPALNAAVMTMPLAMLAGIPAFAGLHSLYSWTHLVPTLTNTFYLNSTGSDRAQPVELPILGLWVLLRSSSSALPRRREPSSSHYLYGLRVRLR